MTWDTTKPAGSRALNLGDDDIRELKTDIQTSLRGNAAEGTEAMFPGSDTANPIFRYRGLKGTTAARPASGQYGLYVNTTLNTIQRDNGSSWDSVATLIPAGTAMAFYQASAPTGWTAVAVNDKFLRVVTAGGTGGTTGGSVAASTSLAHTHTVSSHTHDLANHTHTFAHTHNMTTTGSTSNLDTATGNKLYDAGDAATMKTGMSAGGTALAAISTQTTQPNTSNETSTPSSNTSSAATPGTDSQLGAFAYADVIICSKD